MRAYAAPFVEFLTEPPQALSGEETVSFLEGDGGYTLQEAAAAERALVERMTFSVLGVATRCLQSNPDPLRNAAFMSVPDSSAVFPPEVVEHCPRLPAEDLASIKALRISEDLLRRTTQRSPLPSSAFLPRRPVLLDAITVREGLTIVRSAASYTSGVRAAIGLGGPVCQRAMLVGALLGAKYGARHIPPGWLSATARHKVLSTFSIDVAQWAWNPPHH
ncbi:hypothetical protein AGDE_06287 [Angomonas deanei]|nr:hypothetical protein AGDE_06287 [Angomonas deanei]|eukprot:EPY37647.1 hypothetical protein AGDE_06287 [Angomonas deanei]